MYASHCSRSSFKPAWWLNHRHLQTIYPALLRRVKHPQPLKHERLATDDGDFVDIEWCGDGAGALVILLHGLTGSTCSGYIKGFQVRLLQLGIRSVAMNFRGCGGKPNRLARSYHAGDTEDLDSLFRLIRQREPDTAVAAIGFSLGGSVLLNWVALQGEACGLQAAAAVCVPLVLAECASKLDRGVSRVYRNSLIRELKHYITVKHQALIRAGLYHEAEKIEALGPLNRIKSFWDYDNRVVAALHGYRNVHHYYQTCSARSRLAQIRIPTLLIQSEDDPFMTPAVLPRQQELSPVVVYERIKGGGHVGFVGGLNPLKPHYWLEQRIPEFLSAYIAGE